MGTWPGSPPVAVPDMCNVKPGDFDPEPNWRKRYEILKVKYNKLVEEYNSLVEATSWQENL